MFLSVSALLVLAQGEQKSDSVLTFQ